MKFLFALSCSMLLAVSFASAQQSPAEEATGSIGGKSLSIKYCAPSVRDRKIFGDGGLLSQETNYPVWRAGANDATALHTDGDLDIGGLKVPKGDYTLYVLLSDPNTWQLIINKQTGQWGLSYDKSQDLGRVKMAMSKPSSSIEQLKYVITGSGNKGTLQLEWGDHIASVPVTAK